MEFPGTVPPVDPCGSLVCMVSECPPCMRMFVGTSRAVGLTLSEVGH